MVSSERYEGIYTIDLLPSIIPPISFGNPVECMEVSRVGLAEVLRAGAQKTVDSVVIDYDDSQNNQYSRRFTLTRNVDKDESIAWIPGPICLRGKTQTPQPEVQSIIELREKLDRAALYPKTQQAAQQYARELREATEQLGLLQWRLEAYPKGCVIWSLEGEVKRLADRLERLMGVAKMLEALPDFELSKLLERPLNKIDPLHSNSSNRIDAWKFQDDFTALRERLLPYGSLSLDMLAYTIPGDASARDIQGVLERTATKLGAYAATLFESNPSAAS
jgi:hypothetical protein